MKTIRLFAAAALLIAATSALPAHAEVLVLEPTQSAVLPQGGGPETEVAFYFDLSSLPDDEGRVIDMAHLEWTPSDEAVDEAGAFTATEINASWTAEVAALEGLTSLAETRASKWRVEPSDFERTAGLVKLDLTELVTAWANEDRTNYGVRILSGVLSRIDAGNTLGNARLVIRYGYR